MYSGDRPPRRIPLSVGSWYETDFLMVGKHSALPCPIDNPENQLRRQIKIQVARFKASRKNWILMQQVGVWWNI